MDSLNESLTVSETGIPSRFKNLKTYTRKTDKYFFEPLIHKEEVKDLKYKDMYLRSKENELYKTMKNSNLSQEKKLKLTHASVYYPGRLNISHNESPLKFSIPSPVTIFSESEPDFSPKYLFKDLPKKIKKPQPNLDSPIERVRCQPRDYNRLSPPTTPRFSLVANLGEVECYPPTPKSQQSQHCKNQVEEISPVLAKLGLANESHNNSLPIEASDEDPSTTHYSDSFNLEQITESQGWLTSPVLSGPRKQRKCRALETDHITKRKNQKCPSIEKKLRLDFSDEIEEQTINEPVESYETRLIESSVTIEPKTTFFLLVPKKYDSKHMSIIEEFCKKFNGRWMNFKKSFNYEITHVLAETKPDCPDLVDKVRFEHILAVGHRRYLVSIHWLEDSLAKRQLLKTESYEVRLKPEISVSVAKLARETDELLFEGMTFLCAKPFTSFTQAALEELLIANGAKVVSNPTELHKMKECKERYCIVGERVFWDKAENKKALAKQLKAIPVIHYKWIYKCLSVYKREPLSFVQL